MTACGKEIGQTLCDAIVDKIGQIRFEMWFGSRTCIECRETLVHVTAPSAFAADWIRAHYLSEIRVASQLVLGNVFDVEIASVEKNVSAKDNRIAGQKKEKNVISHDMPVALATSMSDGQNPEVLKQPQMTNPQKRHHSQKVAGRRQPRPFSQLLRETGMVSDASLHRRDIEDTTKVQQHRFLSPVTRSPVTRTPFFADSRQNNEKDVNYNDDHVTDHITGYCNASKVPFAPVVTAPIAKTVLTSKSTRLPCQAKKEVVANVAPRLATVRKHISSKQSLLLTTGSILECEPGDHHLTPSDFFDVDVQQTAGTDGTCVTDFREEPVCVDDAPCEFEVVLPVKKLKALPAVKSGKAGATKAAGAVHDAVAKIQKNSTTPNAAKKGILANESTGNNKSTKANDNNELTKSVTNNTSPLLTKKLPVENWLSQKEQTTGSQSVLKRDAANRNVVAMPGSKNHPATKSVGNSKTTLERFVVGPSNRLAVRAAELAVRYTGKISPIYIYGPTSVGKTHLLESIKIEQRRDVRTKQPLLMTAEMFTSSFIEGLKQGMPLFRNKFRGISTLLIDDVQFFAGKDSTQTEFLRTLETLKSQGVQVVLTGDRSVGALSEILKPEIVSRIEAGMHCEIRPAEYETLLAIFQQMAESRNIRLSNEVCHFVVSNLTTHARQLSGAINRLHATILTTGRAITLELTESILDDLIRNNRRAIRLQDIDKIVCETFQLNGQTLQSKSRAKQVTHPRMLAMWLARKYTRLALSEIGKYFGDRSHSTVVSAQKKISQWLQDAPETEFSETAMSLSDIVQKVERVLQTS